MIQAALLVAVTFSALTFMQAAVPQSGTGKIGASAVWQPPVDFLAKAHAVCDKGAGPVSSDECFINQMSVAGAPAEAANFSRMLSRQTDGQVGIMTAFKSVGPVDLAQVFYPLRANDNYGLLLVNGDPSILDVDDLQKLDRAAMQQDPMFQGIRQQFPQADVWPGDRSGSTPWPRVVALPNGGTQFVVSYPLINGCHACQRVGVARFGWEFDASGKFLKAVFIPTPLPAKPLKRPHGPPPGTEPPSTEPQVQDQQTQPPPATQKPQ